mgnify:CR=1 FL=1
MGYLFIVLMSLLVIAMVITIINPLSKWHMRYWYLMSLVAVCIILLSLMDYFKGVVIE